MKIYGSNVVSHPIPAVWNALLDPAVLVATIPGCERLTATGENAYDMTVTAGVAAIKGTYRGVCSLFDLDENHSLTMKLSGSGAPGTVDATVTVSFNEATPGTTRIDYEADAVVGGMVGGVGQRMLTSVSKRMAAQFFGNVAAAIENGSAQRPDESTAAATGPTTAASPGQPVAATASAPAPAADQVFTAPGTASAGRTGAPKDLLIGLVAGAGVALAGVVVGAVLGRRR